MSKIVTLQGLQTFANKLKTRTCIHGNISDGVKISHTGTLVIEGKNTSDQLVSSVIRIYKLSTGTPKLEVLNNGDVKLTDSIVKRSESKLTFEGIVGTYFLYATADPIEDLGSLDIDYINKSGTSAVEPEASDKDIRTQFGVKDFRCLIDDKAVTSASINQPVRIENFSDYIIFQSDISYNISGDSITATETGTITIINVISGQTEKLTIS